MNTALNTVTLVDGYVTHNENNNPIVYKSVVLRPATVAMDIRAIELAERIVHLNGKSTLMMSDSMYALAMTMQRIERFKCSGAEDIDHTLVDMSTIGKLSPHDVGLIEAQVFVMDLAEQVRYGKITQVQFDTLMAGESSDDEPTDSAPPQPTGETVGVDEYTDTSRPTARRLD